MKITRDTLIEGQIFLINKELSWTSFDVVKKVRYKLQNQFKIQKLKVGHAGTLDPLATGLVILCTGKATKKINDIQCLEKKYIATIKLGETTPSFDLETAVDHQFPIQHITKDVVIKVLNKYKGQTEQIPPVFSAKKYDGKRAYEYARKGEHIELKAKTIEIKEIDLLRFDLPLITLSVVCSKGTYIRALARDLGISLESGAHLTGLKRSAIGGYKLEQAMKISEFENYINGL